MPLNGRTPTLLPPGGGGAAVPYRLALAATGPTGAPPGAVLVVTRRTAPLTPLVLAATLAGRPVPQAIAAPARGTDALSARLLLASFVGCQALLSVLLLPPLGFFLY